MFTKNWYKAIAAHMANNGGGSIKSICVDNYAAPSCYSMGETINLMKDGNNTSSLARVCTSLSASSSNSGVVFGTGTTPPTLDDYKLSGDLITGISASIGTSYEWQVDGVVYVGNYTISNNSAKDITIGEVGLVSCTNSNYSPILMERTVLDSPVTIPAGGVGKVTYTIRMNYPT